MNSPAVSKDRESQELKAKSVSVVRLLVIALIALALLQVAADLAALMVAEAADELLALSTAEVWRLLVLGAALFVLATPDPSRQLGGRLFGSSIAGVEQ
jgi:hypothetical protein